MKNKILIIFSLLFLVFSKTEAQSLLRNGEIPKDLLITLERTVCYGSCPAYKLSIDFNGNVGFNGGNFTKKRGKAAGKISQNQIKDMIAEFEKSDFFNLRDSYEEARDGCTEFETDNPSEIISIQINGKKKRISHYFGCLKVDGNPTELVETLGVKIDQITNSKHWIEPKRSYAQVERDILREKSQKKKSKRKKLRD